MKKIMLSTACMLGLTTFVAAPHAQAQQAPSTVHTASVAQPLSTKTYKVKQWHMSFKLPEKTSTYKFKMRNGELEIKRGKEVMAYIIREKRGSNLSMRSEYEVVRHGNYEYYIRHGMNVFTEMPGTAKYKRQTKVFNTILKTYKFY